MAETPIFLFTDIEGSTGLWREHGALMKNVLSRHDSLLQRVIAASRGTIVKNTGDGVFAVFRNGGALDAALEIQRLVAAADWGEIGELRLRIGLHAGPAEERDGDFFGPAVNCAARVTQAAWGGQILLTDEAAEEKAPPGSNLLDLGVHLLKGLATPIRLFQLSHPALPWREFPPPRTLNARPHNLPIQTTPFFGRETELAAIRSLLAEPSCRCLTLIGPGGIGKTRLALQAAAELLDEYEWGTYFVPLDPITTPADVPGAIAAALRFTLSSKASLEQQLLSFLSDKKMLLVLDNFEHIIAAATYVSELVAAAPNLQILATSRERLNIRAESLFPVSGIPYPPEGAPSPREYGAVRFFLDAARRTNPSFAPDDHDLAAIAAICRDLEGIPLAVEIAASWTRTLTPSQIQRQVQTGNDELTSLYADAPPRHKSLRAVWEYSYALLKETEQLALARLGLFPGDFSLDAARHVAGADLGKMTSFLDKCLVRRCGTGRFELHPLLRQYARDKLPAAEEEETLRRYTAFYLKLLDDIDASRAREGQKYLIDRIGADLHNVRGAWANAVVHSDPSRLERAAETLSTFYRLTGRFAEGERELSLANAAINKAARDHEGFRVRARFGARWGSLLFSAGKKAEAERKLRTAVADARRSSDAAAMALALYSLAVAYYQTGKKPAAYKILLKSLALFEALDDSDGIANVTLTLGTVAALTGRYQEARAYYDRSLDLSRVTGDLNRIANITNNLGSIIAWEGDVASAEPYFKECCEASREIGNNRLAATSLYNLATAAAQRREYDEARKLFGEALALAKYANDYISAATTCAAIAETFNTESRHEEARAAAAEGLAFAEKTERREGYAYCRWHLGDAFAGLGRWEEALASLRTALAEAVALQEPRLTASIMLSVAELRRREGNTTYAAAVLASVIAHPPDAVVASLARRYAERYFPHGLPSPTKSPEDYARDFLADTP